MSPTIETPSRTTSSPGSVSSRVPARLRGQVDDHRAVAHRRDRRGRDQLRRRAAGDERGRDHDVKGRDLALERLLLAPLVLVGQLLRVAALGLLADDAEVEEAGAEALDLLAHHRPDVEAGHDRAEPARGRDRLKPRDPGAEHEHLRRRHGPGRRHQHRKEPGQPLCGEQRGLVAGDRGLRGQCVHRLRPGDPRDRLEREARDAAPREPLDAFPVRERLEEPDQRPGPRGGARPPPRSASAPSRRVGRPRIADLRAGARDRPRPNRTLPRRAPASTTTPKPAPVSLPTISGTSATRRSPGALSFGTAILTARGTLKRNTGGRCEHEHRGPCGDLAGDRGARSVHARALDPRQRARRARRPPTGLGQDAATAPSPSAASSTTSASSTSTRRCFGSPARLTEREFSEIKRHPQAGAKMIRGLEQLRPALPYILFHHERWDGRGYPSGRSREQIPIGARIVAVVDAFDAMISLRPYRPPLLVQQRSGARSSATPAPSSTRASCARSSPPGTRASSTPSCRTSGSAPEAQRADQTSSFCFVRRITSSVNSEVEACPPRSAVRTPSATASSEPSRIARPASWAPSSP